MKSLYVSSQRVLTAMVCSSVLLVLSCQKDGSTLVSPDLKGESRDPVYNYILSLGFREDKIVDEGQYYTVEGDISFEKQPRADRNARPSHSVFSGMPVINYTNVDNINITVGNSFTSTAWRNKIVTATQAAINSWNNISSSSKIHFNYVTGPAEITVNYDPSLDNTDYFARGGMPTNCNISPSVRLAAITDDSYELNAAQLHFLMVHELGHSIGFRHTNEGSTNGFHIGLTPLTEPGSIMNSGSPTELTPEWPGFSAGDKQASEELYPINANGYLNWNSGINRMVFTWPMSRFCATTVSVEVYKDGVYEYSMPVPNNGRFTYSTPPSPGNYEFTVYASNRNDNLSDSYLLYY